MTTPIKFPENSFLVASKRLFVAKDRGREDFKSVNDLVESIRDKGLIIPLSVLRVKQGGKLEKRGFEYKLVAGQTRFNAMAVLGITEIPCSIFSKLSAVEQKEFELMENIVRKDLSWHEQTKILEQIDTLKREQLGDYHAKTNPEGWNLEKTAKLVNRPQGTVTRMVGLEKKFQARPDIKEQVKDLPINVATKKVKEIQQQENLTRLEKKGKLKFKTNLRNGSCLELIKELADDSVNLVVTDPPFGVSEIEDERETDRGTHESYKRVLENDDNLGLDDATKLVTTLIPELYRVMAPGAHLYMFFAFDIFTPIREGLLDAGFSLQPYPIIWDKGRTTSIWKGYNYTPCYEPIFYAMKPPRVKRMKEAAKAILTEKIIPSREKIHPFEKPQGLLRRLIEQSSNKGETVLDPFAGSGSTLVAAQSLKRSGIGFELSRNNFLRAQARLMGEGESEE